MLICTFSVQLRKEKDFKRSAEVIMDIQELTKKLKNRTISYTTEETKQILIDAKVLINDGSYNPEMFSNELVKKSQQALKRRR